MNKVHLFHSYTCVTSMSIRLSHSVSKLSALHSPPLERSHSNQLTSPELHATLHSAAVALVACAAHADRELPSNNRRSVTVSQQENLLSLIQDLMDLLLKGVCTLQSCLFAFANLLLTVSITLTTRRACRMNWSSESSLPVSIL